MSPASASFLVGDFLVAPDRNELRQLDEATGRPSGEPVKLTSKQMDVLVTLAAKAGQPVSKNELFDAVWPGVTVGEDNISSCIYELRKALGTPYIQTVRNRGYLLAARVERELPPGLLESLEPPRRESAEILLAGVVADPPSSGSPAPAAPPTVRALPPAFDRQTLRKLFIAFASLALAAAAGLFGVRYWGTFTVGLKGCENRTGEPELDARVESLETRLFEALDAPAGTTYYRVRELNFFAGTQVSCTLTRGKDSEDDDLQLSAVISGDRTGPEQNIHMVAPRKGLERVSDQLFERVSRELDRRVCQMETAPTLLKAKHCLDAGKRFIKSRSYTEAEKSLLRGAEIYAGLQDRPEAKTAGQGLLEARYALSNLYDILGFVPKALDQIKAALALAAEPILELPPKSIQVLKIKRRSAQIAGDVKAEKNYLNEILDADRNDPDARHSMGWFMLTHERDCGVLSLKQFDEARDEETDPLLRATYHSYSGDIQLACGLPGDAIKSYTKHIEALPEEADPYDARASAYIMIGSYDKAHNDLTYARKLDPNLASIYLKKGDLKRDLGSFQDAKREYGSALANFRQWPNEKRDILVALGRLALLEGDMASALEYALNAIDSQGGNQVQPYWLLGFARLGSGDLEGARSALAFLEKHFAETPSKYLLEYLHHLKAQILLADHQDAEALAQLDAALANNPADRLFFLTAKAEGLEKAGRPAEALEAYRALLRINPEHRRSLCAAARLAKKLEPAASKELYTHARDILGSSSDDPACQSCLELAAEFLDSP